MKRAASIFGAITALFAASSSPAQAAPQILAVMASLGPQQMSCGGSICTTSFTSYCLQRDRDVPPTGQAYMPAHPAQFSLVVIGENGAETLLPAGDHISFSSVRGYASVNATIGRDALAALGGTGAKIVVAKGAALIPEPVAGDPNPVTEAEMAFTTKSLREHGDDIVDTAPAGQAAAVISRIAATIVPSAPATPDSLQQLWHDVIDNIGPAHPVGNDAIERARGIYDWCQGRTSYHSMGGIKSCLEFKHDVEIMRLNGKYWDSQPGY